MRACYNLLCTWSSINELTRSSIITSTLIVCLILLCYRSGTSLIIMQALISSVDREDIAVATGSRFKTFNTNKTLTESSLPVSYLFRTSGQVLGVSLTGALAQNILRNELRERIRGPGAEEV